MRNEGRAEAFMARSTISQFIAAGIDTQRCSNPACVGRHHTMVARFATALCHALGLAFTFGVEDHDRGTIFMSLYDFQNAELEILQCFSRRSLPHLTITFRPARLTTLLWTDESHKNDGL
jgi:hypothetical protein